MFLKTEKFLFLDIINYLGPGTSYAAWVKGLRMFDTEVMAVLRVDGLSRKAELPRPARLSSVVFETERRVRPETLRVHGM